MGPARPSRGAFVRAVCSVLVRGLCALVRAVCSVFCVLVTCTPLCAGWVRFGRVCACPCPPFARRVCSRCVLGALCLSYLRALVRAVCSVLRVLVTCARLWPVLFVSLALL